MPASSSSPSASITGRTLCPRSTINRRASPQERSAVMVKTSLVITSEILTFSGSRLGSTTRARTSPWVRMPRNLCSSTTATALSLLSFMIRQASRTLAPGESVAGLAFISPLSPIAASLLSWIVGAMTHECAIPRSPALRWAFHKIARHGSRPVGISRRLRVRELGEKRFTSLLRRLQTFPHLVEHEREGGVDCMPRRIQIPPESIYRRQPSRGRGEEQREYQEQCDQENPSLRGVQKELAQFGHGFLLLRYLTRSTGQGAKSPT